MSVGEGVLTCLECTACGEEHPAQKISAFAGHVGRPSLLVTICS